MHRRLCLTVLSLAALLAGAFSGPAAASWARGPLPPPAAATSSPPPEGDSTPVWSIEIPDSAKLFRSMEDRSLALDAAGYPHIAYGDDQLFYAWYDGAMWHYETVDTSPDVGEHAALRLDSQGRAHISYYDRYNGYLRYAFRAGPHDWQVQVVDTAGSC